MAPTIPQAVERQLHATRARSVSGELVDAQRTVEFVQIESHAGAEYRLRNLFAGAADVYRDGNKGATLSGSLPRFPARKSERLVLVAAGADPASFKRAVPEV
jgi:hypothetical protein